MAMDTRWAAEVGWQDIGIADAAHPWRARSESRSEASWLSASILHDLRNPMGTIYAGAEMLMTLDTAPNQVKRLAANMHRAASRMRELLIDLASATYGNRSTPEICDIREIIAAASEAAAAAMDNQRVQILLDVPGQIKLPLARSRMKLMFFNLITNALEAMPGGGQIRIGARKAENIVLIHVEDTGPGIPRAIRDRLFEPFVTAGKRDGLGLGLMLARQTVLDHGGDMWTESAAGARFVIRLPLNRHPRYSDAIILPGNGCCSPLGVSRDHGAGRGLHAVVKPREEYTARASRPYKTCFDLRHEPVKEDL